MGTCPPIPPPPAPLPTPSPEIVTERISSAARDSTTRNDEPVPLVLGLLASMPLCPYVGPTRLLEHCPLLSATTHSNPPPPPRFCCGLCDRRIFLLCVFRKSARAQRSARRLHELRHTHPGRWPVAAPFVTPFSVPSPRLEERWCKGARGCSFRAPQKPPSPSTDRHNALASKPLKYSLCKIPLRLSNEPQPSSPLKRRAFTHPRSRLSFT